MSTHIYLEFRDGKSDKFWEVKVRGTKLSRRWGRFGTDGQEKVEIFGKASVAEAKAKALFEEKLKGGYVRSHPDPEIGRQLARARAIRRDLGGSNELTLPFPSKPAGCRWTKYWDLYLEARDLERGLAAHLERPKLWGTGNKRWKMTSRPRVNRDFSAELSNIKMPESTRKILTQLSTIERREGILMVEAPVDLATIFIMLNHGNAHRIKQIRHGRWKPIDLQQTRKKRSTSLRQFRMLSHVDVPDFILELGHYIDSMRELGPFRDCYAHGLEDTSYGIFESLMIGMSPGSGGLRGGPRFPFHQLNYFAIVQLDLVTAGVAFDFETNSFSPYIFDCDTGGVHAVGGIWDYVLESIEFEEELYIDLDDFKSVRKLNALLKDDIDNYSVLGWFFKLATVGYLNYHDKPSLGLRGLDQIRFAGKQSQTNPIRTGRESFWRSLGASNLVREAIQPISGLPEYPIIRISGNFHPAFTDATLSELLWACKYFNPDSIDKFVKTARTSRMDLLSQMGFEGEGDSQKTRSEGDFYGTVIKFCENEIDVGRPYLALFVALAIWNGSSLDWRKASAGLLHSLPDEICHPILKLTAEANSNPNPG